MATNDPHDSRDPDDEIRLTRRTAMALLAAAGVGGAAVGANTLDDPQGDPNLQTGGISTNLTDQKRRDQYVTAPDSAFDPSQLQGNELAWVTDTGEIGVYNGSSLEHPPLGSSSNPVPSINTDRVHTDSRNAEVVIRKNDNGNIEIDGPDGDISFSGDIMDAIQAANDAAPSGGWHIHIAAGQYDFDNTFSDGEAVKITKPIKLTGAGYATHIRAKDGTADSGEGIRAISVQSDGVQFHDFRIDSNQQNNNGDGDGNTIQNSTDGHNIRVGTNGGASADDFIMSGVWSVNSTGDGVEPMGSCTGATITGNIFRDCWEQCVHYDGCSDVVVDGNLMDGEVNNAVVSTFSSDGQVCSGCELTNNRILNGQVEGVAIYPGDGTVEDFLVEGNQIENMTDEGIRVFAGNQQDNPPRDIRIKNNTVRECGGGAGSEIRHGDGITVQNNDVVRNEKRGISVDANGGNITDCRVDGNNVKNNGVSTTSPGVLVRDRGNTLEHVRVTDNDVLVTDTDADHGTGIQAVDDGGTQTKCLLYDNHIDGSSSQATNYDAGYGHFFGESTIGSTETSTTVTHGLGKSPDPARLSAMPLDDLGSASYFYIDDANINSSTFKIKVDAQPGSNVRFSWQIQTEG